MTVAMNNKQCSALNFFDMTCRKNERRFRCVPLRFFSSPVVTGIVHGG